MLATEEMVSKGSQVDNAEEAKRELEELKLPDMILGSLLVYFWPGIILMMTGIGTSHVVTAPTAGGRFAYALL